MDQTVNTQGIAQGFGALARALAPNYDGMIKADLARANRQNTEADTRYRDALTGKVGVETSTLQAQAAAQEAMRVALASGDMESVANIGAVLAGLSTTPGGIKDGPAFVTGARTHLDPEFAQSPGLSNIMLGTGVVSDFDHTPAGHQAALDADMAQTEATNATTLEGILLGNQGALDLQGAKNQGDLAVQGAKNQGTLDLQGVKNQGALDLQGVQNQGNLALQDDEQAFKVENPHLHKGTASTPKTYTMTPLDAQRAVGDLTAAIKDKAGGVNPSPSVVAQVMAAASEIYKTTGNWPAAQQQALALFNFTTEDNSYWPTGDTDVVASPIANALAGVGNTPAPAPAAPNGAGAGVTVQGQHFAEGEEVQQNGYTYVVRGGQMVPK